MLAGDKVVRLLPFLQARGFQVEAYADGGAAASALRRMPCHLLLVELEVGEMMGADLARTMRREQRTAGALLVEDPIRAGQIIAALARGDVDSYVALPPDEAVFLARLEELLLGQWGATLASQQQALTDEVQRLRGILDKQQDSHRQELAKATQDASARGRELQVALDQLADLKREITVLREQLSTMHLLAGVKTGNSDEGGGLSDPGGAPVLASGFDLLDGQRTESSGSGDRGDADDEFETAVLPQPRSAGVRRPGSSTDFGQTEPLTPLHGPPTQPSQVSAAADAARPRPGRLPVGGPSREGAPAVSRPPAAAFENDVHTDEMARPKIAGPGRTASTGTMPSMARTEAPGDDLDELPEFLQNTAATSFEHNDQPTAPHGYQLDKEGSDEAPTKALPSPRPQRPPPIIESPRTIVDSGRRPPPQEEEVLFLDDD